MICALFLSASKTPIPTDPEFLSRVAELIPLSEYRPVFRTLIGDQSKADRLIENIEYDNQAHGMQEMKYQMLFTWMKKAPPEKPATIEQLQDALVENGCKRVADKCPEILKDIEHKHFGEKILYSIIILYFKEVSLNEQRPKTLQQGK